MQLVVRITCPVCHAVAEQPGNCHAPRVLTRGVSWLDNDAVNLAGSCIGATVAIVGWHFLHHLSG